MDIILNTIYYLSTVPLEQLIASFVGICTLLYACYYAVAQHRYTMNRRFTLAKVKQLGGAPLSEAEQTILFRRNKYCGTHHPFGFKQLVRPIITIKHAIKSRWHKMLTSFGTDYNPWFLQDKIKRLQRENNSISTDKWTYYHKVNELQKLLDKYMLGIDDKESEKVSVLDKSKPKTNKASVQKANMERGLLSTFV